MGLRPLHPRKGTRPLNPVFLLAFVASKGSAEPDVICFSFLGVWGRGLPHIVLKLLLHGL